LNKPLLILLFCILLRISSFAQDPYVYPIGSDQGISTETTYNVYQDQKGFLWFASDAGLIQYDGNVSTLYKHKEFDAGAGTCIREDIYGRIWYITFRGQIFFVENDSIKCHTAHAPSRYSPMGVTKKHLFAFSNLTLHIYNLGNLNLVKSISLENDYVQHAYSDSTYFYYTKKNNLYRIDSNLKSEMIRLPALPSAGLFKVYSANKNLYVLASFASQYKLFIYNQDLDFLTSMDLSVSGSINDLVFVSQEMIIIGSKGFQIQSLHSNGLPNLQKTRSMFNNYNISSIIKDTQSHYWMSTLWDGIFMIPNIQNIQIELEGEKPIRITGNGDDVWISSHRGSIYSYDITSGTVVKRYEDKNRNGIYFLKYDSQDNTLRYSSRGFTSVDVSRYIKKAEYDYSVKAFERIDHKYIIAGTSLALLLLRYSTTESSLPSEWDSLFDANPSNGSIHDASLIPKVWIKDIVYDTVSGIAYATDGNKIYTVRKERIDTLLIDAGSVVFSSLCMEKGRLYAVSVDGKLWRLYGNKELKPEILEYQGKSILVQQMKSTTMGCFLSDGNRLFKFTPGAPLQAVQIKSRGFSIHDFYVTRHNLILATDEGIIHIPYALDSANSYVPLFYLRSLWADKQKYSANQVLEFDANTREVIIAFSLIDYSRKHHENLLYRINQNAWIPIPSGQSQLVFPSLASGEYEIQFKSGDHIFSERLRFTILKPIWKRVWFLVLMSLMGLCCLYLYYRWQIRLLRNKIQLLNDKVQLERDLGKMALTSIKSQMNPHFFYNALNTIQAYIFTNDKKNASGYLSKFSSLTRMILDMSEREKVSLTEEIQALTLYLELENMRFSEKIDFQIITESLDADLIQLPSMLIQPYVENAVKHGLLHKSGNRILRIEFQMQDYDLFVRIEDNGIGRKRAMEILQAQSFRHTSFSTQANARRLDILNRMRNRKVNITFEDKYDNESQASGTVVTLYIPIDFHGK
jgi:hypothetical protein